MTSPREIGQRARWVTIYAEAAHYVDDGLATILCDRLPRPITLVLKNPVLRDAPPVSDTGERG